MGVSFGNLGEYEEAARYYLRALAMNPDNSGVWGYLKTVLICGGHMSLLPLVDSKDLEQLKMAISGV